MSLQDVFEEINWRWCRYNTNTVPLSHIGSTVSDGVSPSPKGGGAESARPPLNLPLHTHIHTYTHTHTHTHTFVCTRFAKRHNSKVLCCCFALSFQTCSISHRHAHRLSKSPTARLSLATAVKLRCHAAMTALCVGLCTFSADNCAVCTGSRTRSIERRGTYGSSNCCLIDRISGFYTL